MARRAVLVIPRLSVISLIEKRHYLDGRYNRMVDYFNNAKAVIQKQSI